MAFERSSQARHLSVGANNLIKSGGTLIASAQDVLDALGLKNTSREKQAIFGDNQAEQSILDLMEEGISELDALQVQSQLDPATFSQTITMLEISGKIRPLGGAHWILK